MAKRTKKLKIAAGIPICEEDAGYLPNLLYEIERMDVDVAWALNNCSEETVQLIREFKRTVWWREFSGPFHNCLRNYPLEAVELDYDWFLQWDADEVWEPKAPEKLRDILSKSDAGLIQVRMAHVWEKDGKNMLTTDWASERDRIYNMDKSFRWRYLNRVTAGPTNLYNGDKREGPVNLWMIHYGYATEEKRRKHRARWDRLHSISMGKNPYGMWKTITEPGYEPDLFTFEELYKVL